jgi:integrase
MSAASIGRRLSAVAKLYAYGIETAEVLTYSPVAHVRRPKVTSETTAIGLSAAELVALLDTAENHSTRFGALVALLGYNGLRIGEALAADVADYTHQRGHRVLRITRKGGRVSTQPLAPPTVRAIDTYLAAGHPPAGPLFLDRTHTTRLAYETACAQFRRLARGAAIPAADQITPHSLRHTFVTEALAAVVPLQDVQDAAGHADPGITRRYDRSRLSLDRHPTYILAAHLHRTTADHDQPG